MLTLQTKSVETWDEKSETFGKTKPITFRLEHSLLSVSKWESAHKKPFLTKGNKTNAEMLDYIRCMDLDKHKPEDYLQLTQSDLDAIGDYISDGQTATWFAKTESKSGRHEIITAELIYYWIFAYEIDVSCEKWHLNRLLTLIRVFSEKTKENTNRNKSNGKLTSSDIDKRRALMESRRKQYSKKV